jgi:hypothetical protein
MQLIINPHKLVMMGENSFVRLSTDGGKTVSSRCSHWRVQWSPVGVGHALLVDSAHVGGIKIYSDNEPVVRLLQKEIEALLYKAFGDVSIPVIPAKFERAGDPPGVCHEIVRAGNDELRLTWSDFIEPFNFERPVGFDGHPIGCQTSFFPANVGAFSLNGKNAEGASWRMDRQGTPCTTACLAWLESWFKQR